MRRAPGKGRWPERPARGAERRGQGTSPPERSDRVLERRKRNERGIVMVWSAFLLLGLLTFAGLSVDVGNWYLQASKLQRAVDAAALAGAAKMPDAGAADAAARAAFAHNAQWSEPNVQITVTPQPPNKVEVEVVRNNVKTVFASFLIDKISIKRHALAEFRKPLALGNPGNILGSGTLTLTSGPALSSNYWLAVNGYCTAAEDGDPISSRYDGNRVGGATICDGSQGAELNPDYNPNGYNYMIDVPIGAPAKTISVFDPAYNAGGTGPLGTSPDATAEQASDGPVNVTTSYTLYDLMDPFNYADDVVINRDDYRSDSIPACAQVDWCIIGSNLPSGKKYKLNVRTQENELDSEGINAFSLMASNTAPTSMDSCDARIDPLCPQVYAMNAISMFVNVSPAEQRVDLFVTNVDLGYAGSTLTLSMWDPGEGGNDIRLLAPNGEERPFIWQATPDNPDDPLSGTDTALDISGTGSPTGPNRIGEGRFNDRMVKMRTAIPIAYDTFVEQAGGNTWWKFSYTMNSTSPPQDRTTWLAKVDDQSPSRLLE